MLSAILRSDVAINVSIGIMRAFVEMRKFLATNSLILNRVDELEMKQLEYKKTRMRSLIRCFSISKIMQNQNKRFSLTGKYTMRLALLRLSYKKPRKKSS